MLLKLFWIQILNFKTLKICLRFSFMYLMLATLGALHSTSWELHWCSILLLQNSVALVRVFSHLHLCDQIGGLLWRHCSGAGNSDSGITPRGKSIHTRYMYELTSTFFGFLRLKSKKKKRMWKFEFVNSLLLWFDVPGWRDCTETDHFESTCESSDYFNTSKKVF